MFESVDYFAKVWVNGELLGEHEGYFNPFEFDITNKVRPGKNVVAVKVTNPWDYAMRCRGKSTQRGMAEKIWVKSVLNYHNSRLGTDHRQAPGTARDGAQAGSAPGKNRGDRQPRIDWVLISPGAVG